MDTGVIDIKRLFPQLDQEQLKQAEDNLELYLAVVLRIYQRISLDPEALAELRRDLEARSLEF